MSDYRKYPLADVKILYGLAAGRCSFPTCRQEVVLDEESDQKRKQIGKIGHIIAHGKGGPRPDSSYPREKLDTYDNWVLCCPTHHDTVDVQDSKYPVDELRRIKQEHEMWVRYRLASEMPSVGFAELEVVAKAIAVSSGQPSDDFITTKPREKLKKNNLGQPIEMLVTMGYAKIREVRDFVQHVSIIDSEFPERLKRGFVEEYEKLVMEGLSGDALFLSMHRFSCGGSQEFIRMSAGLAILSYLFEACEVFEK